MSKARLRRYKFYILATASTMDPRLREDDKVGIKPSPAPSHKSHIYTS